MPGTGRQPAPKNISVPGGSNYVSVSAPALTRNSGQGQAIVIVDLPADAKLTINGWKSANTNSTRRFRSPPLESGKAYTYDLRAEVVRDGQTMVQTRQIVVFGGRETRVPFDFPAVGVSQNKRD
jgi:uncharacterized protein (TIGR03000 family)